MFWGQRDTARRRRRRTWRDGERSQEGVAAVLSATSLGREKLTARSDHVAAAIRWCALSVGWALLVGATSLVVGLSTNSTALVGFGLSSLVDGTASSVLVWRFRHERLGVRAVEEVERRAALVIGVILLLIGVYVAIRAAVALAGHSEPEHSPFGVALTSASILVLPVLAMAKLRLARRLRSQALRADGVLSGAGAVLAAAALGGLVLNSAVGWWWADSFAALGIAAALIREGGLSVRSAG